MNDSTPKKKSPRKETINFLKTFARIYQPGMDSVENAVALSKLQSALSNGFC